jgi:hypothetical protein
VAVRNGPNASQPTGVRRSRGSGRDGADRSSRSTVGSVSVSSLYRGRARLELIDLLAMGEVTHGDIARTLGCRVPDVADFAKEHAREIEEVRALLAHDIAVDSTAAGLWIANKRNRLAEIQADIEDINVAIAGLMRGPDAIPGLDVGSKRHMNLLRLKLAGLKAAAEEIDPPRRGAGRPGRDEDMDDRNVVHYVIEGDDDIVKSLT